MTTTMLIFLPFFSSFISVFSDPVLGRSPRQYQDVPSFTNEFPLIYDPSGSVVENYPQQVVNVPMQNAPNNWYPAYENNQPQIGYMPQGPWQPSLAVEQYPYIQNKVPSNIIVPPMDDMWLDGWQYYSNPCMPNIQPPVECNPEFEVVPVCDLQVCDASCIRYIGPTAEGFCQNNECYCRKMSEPQPVPEPEPKPEPEEDPEDWNYDDQDDWPQKFPECGMSPQSPINLLTADIRDLTRKLEFVNYDSELSFLMENHGRGVRLYVQTRLAPSVVISGFSIGSSTVDWSGNFTLAFIDLHWALSEHALEGRKFDMEAQLHHFNPWFDSYEEAVAHQGETVAIAVLFQQSDEIPALDGEIFDTMSKITSPGDIGALTSAKPYLKEIPSRLGTSFVAYLGSLTHPPCRRGVHWMVGADTLQVSPQQIVKLQSLKDKKGDNILQNWRELKTD